MTFKLPEPFAYTETSPSKPLYAEVQMRQAYEQGRAEVLAERDKANSEYPMREVRLLRREKFDLVAERDTLQSKVESQAAEIERLKTVPMKYRRMEFNAQLQEENKQLRAKVAEMEKQEPVAYTVAGEVTNWARDFSKYKTQHYTRPVILAPGAAPDMTRDHYWSKVDARCKELEAKVAEQAAEIERLTGCLKKANDNHEEFERRWYLACEERDQLQTCVSEWVAANGPLGWISELRAKIAEMEKQEPIGYVFDDSENIYTGSVIRRNQIDGYVPVYLAPGAAQKEPCIHKDVPSSCYRVRCQLGSKCIDDDMSFRAAPAAPKVEPYQGPKKFAPEEIADGNRGIRWVTETEVCGRPTDHDVREYLLRTPTAKGCHCEECKAFYRQQPAPAAQPLSDEQIARLVMPYGYSSIQGFDHIKAYTQAVEAHHGIVKEQKHGAD